MPRLRRPASVPARRHAPGDAAAPVRAAGILAEIAGLPAVLLQPAAGAQGELTALLVAAAYFRDRGEKRTKVLVPDSAHGTNPASATMAGFETVTVKSDATGSSTWTTSGQARRPDRRVHDHQPEHASACSTRRSREIAATVHDARRPGLPRRRQHERHPRHRPARRHGRRHDALQPPQDLLRPARRRRPRRGPDRASAKYLAPYLPTPVVVEETATTLPPRLRPPQVDRPRPRASSATSASSSAPTATSAATAPTASRRVSETRRAQRQLPAQPREALPARPARRPLHARVRRLGREAQSRKRHPRDGHRQAAARLRLPRPDRLLPARRSKRR